MNLWTLEAVQRKGCLYICYTSMAFWIMEDTETFGIAV